MWAQKGGPHPADKRVTERRGIPSMPGYFWRPYEALNVTPR